MMWILLNRRLSVLCVSFPFCISISAAKVKVLPYEPYPTGNRETGGWTIPKNNTILILPAQLTGNLRNGLPDPQNFTALSQSIASELQQVLAAQIKF